MKKNKIYYLLFGLIFASLGILCGIISSTTNTDLYWLAGFFVGLAFVAIVYFLIFLISEKTRNKNYPCEFDERQNLARGRAFKYAFMATILSNIILMTISASFKELTWWNNTVMNFIPLIIGFLVFGEIAIFNDSYNQMGENKLFTVILFSVITICELTTSIIFMARGELIVDGKVSDIMICLLSGVFFTIITISYIIKTFYINGKEEDR